MVAANYSVLTGDDQFASVFDSNSTVHALNFWASWAPPCIQMNEVFEELATKNSNIQFIKIEAEKFPEISEKCEIMAVPSFVIVKEGIIVDRVDGANPPELAKIITKYSKSPASLPSNSSTTPVAGSAAPSSTSSALSPEDMNARLKELTSSSSVMVFIKGTPTAP
ncbi:Glutaredoxin 3, partial [Modicella reniformis]